MIKPRSPFIPALLLLSLLFSFFGCGSQSREASRAENSLIEAGGDPFAPDFQDQAPAYETHVLLYGNALQGVDQDLLDNYDTIILEAQALADLEPRHYHKAVLYFNPWAKSTWLDDQRPWPEWQPAPGELGDQPQIEMFPHAFNYRFDDAHVQDFLGWIEDFLVQFPGKVKGVFLDDFAYDKSWWLDICADCDELDADAVWGAMDGRPGWRDDPLWNKPRINTIEEGALALVQRYCGPDASLVLNGIARENPLSRRFAEGAGHYLSESWYKLIEPGVDDLRFMRARDLLQVNSINENGQWAWTGWFDGRNPETGVIEYPYGLFNTIRACSLAVFRDLSVGIAYGEQPAVGDSRYSLLLDPANVPPFEPPFNPKWEGLTTWFYYYGYFE